ncbi:MAG: aspartate aminotransferase family protein [Desulfovibrio sp.]
MTENTVKLKAREEGLICHTYGRYPLTIKSGKGSKLYDFDGKEYIDLLAGIAVTNLGHCNEELHQTMVEQGTKLIHVSNLFYQEEQLELAEKLLSTCGADRVFFANSGAESNEAAIKLARRYQRTVLKKEAYEIITLTNSFHGRTMATLTATGQDGLITEGFAPYPEGFTHVPAEDIKALKAAANDKTAAIMVEVIQGEGGIRPLSQEYVTAVANFCKENDILLIVDEIQSGMCRSGKFWAHQHYGIVPDIFTSSKALANGLPMGAMLATEKVAAGFVPGSHATTFGGGALTSKVAAKVIEIMLRDDIAGRAEIVGRFALSEIESLKARHPQYIIEGRGKGLMLGIELASNGQDVFEALVKRGFILNLSHGCVLRLVPALTIAKEDIQSFMKALDEVLTELG